MASFLRTASRFRPAARFSSIRPITTTTQSRATAAAAAIPETPIEQPFFPDEPAGPQIKTAIPGPNSKKAIQELDNVFDTRSLNMLTNYQQSYGN
jgi:4-aminobutyrate aminotransferase / (S)-3-amino-2-methylpropionate transaminase